MKEFKNEDLFVNRIKVYPKVKIFVHDGKIYYNKEDNSGEVKLQNLINTTGSSG